MKFIKERLNYVIIFFAIVAIIACLFPFATVSTTTNKITTSMAMFFLNLDGSGSSPIGIVVALILIAIIILSFFRSRIPKLSVSIFLLSVAALGITAYYIFNIRAFASSVTSASEDVKIGFGCYSIVLCLLIIIGISAYDLFIGYKKSQKQEEVNNIDNENVQTPVNIQPVVNNEQIPQATQNIASEIVNTTPVANTIPVQQPVENTEIANIENNAIQPALYFESTEVSTTPVIEPVQAAPEPEVVNNMVAPDLNIMSESTSTPKTTEFNQQTASNEMYTNKFIQVPTTVPVETNISDNNMNIFNQTTNTSEPTKEEKDNGMNVFTPVNTEVENNIFNPVQPNDIFNQQPLIQSNDEIEVLDIFDEPVSNNNIDSSDDEFKY